MSHHQEGVNRIVCLSFMWDEWMIMGPTAIAPAHAVLYDHRKWGAMRGTKSALRGQYKAHRIFYLKTVWALKQTAHDIIGREHCIDWIRRSYELSHQESARRGVIIYCGTVISVKSWQERFLRVTSSPLLNGRSITRTLAREPFLGTWDVQVWLNYCARQPRPKLPWIFPESMAHHHSICVGHWIRRSQSRHRSPQRGNCVLRQRYNDSWPEEFNK